MAAVLWLAVTAPLSRSLEPMAPPSITLLTEDGKFIARRGAVIDKPVAINALPPHVEQAFTAIEDRRFRSHWGVDPWGIARAMWSNVKAGSVRQGGSTITQQLAKGAFLNADRTAGRKLREMLIAFWLEAWLTKDQILERYLSNVYFGDNVYGLRAAAKHYFNRTPERLTVSQAAMLAGLLKAPSRLAPTQNLPAARTRSALVVQAMVEAGHLTADQARRLTPARLDVQPMPDSTTGTYFTDWVLAEARDRAGAVYGAQEVTTTLDSAIQRFTVDAIRRAPLGGAQVAAVVMRPDGTVVAMVGGKSYKSSAFNRVTQARRQPGSTFKLFVYLAAIRAGMSPDDKVEDRPITAGDYRPGNSHGRYRGTITLRQAFAVSSNVVAVRLAQEVGMDAVIDAARDLGVTSPLPDNLSIALGSSGVSLMELAQAYAAIAGDSYPVRARGLPEQERSWFARLLDRQRSFSSRELEAMRDLLSAAANGGTGRRAALRTATFGKTGTTQDNRDAIFVGYAGGLITAVWVGNDDNSPLPGVSGGTMPARIWRDIMVRAVERGGTPDSESVPDPRELEQAAQAVANISLPADLGNISVNVSENGVRVRGGPGDTIDVTVPVNPPPVAAPTPQEITPSP
jgi:penicillin-binding protein 1A